MQATWISVFSIFLENMLQKYNDDSSVGRNSCGYRHTLILLSGKILQRLKVVNMHNIFSIFPITLCWLGLYYVSYRPCECSNCTRENILLAIAGQQHGGFRSCSTLRSNQEKRSTSKTHYIKAMKGCVQTALSLSIIVTYFDRATTSHAEDVGPLFIRVTTPLDRDAKPVIAGLHCTSHADSIYNIVFEYEDDSIMGVYVISGTAGGPRWDLYNCKNLILLLQAQELKGVLWKFPISAQLQTLHFL